MNLTALYFAKYNIDEIAEENGIKTFISGSNDLYIELKSGRNFKLSEDEVKYQAIEYLKNQISNIENNF
jgi:hypothetical protein